MYGDIRERQTAAGCVEQANMGIRPANACKGRADTPDRSAGQRDRTAESVADHTVLPCAGGGGTGEEFAVSGVDFWGWKWYNKDRRTPRTAEA